MPDGTPQRGTPLRPAMMYARAHHGSTTVPTDGPQPLIRKAAARWHTEARRKGSGERSLFGDNKKTGHMGTPCNRLKFVGRMTRLERATSWATTRSSTN